MQTFVAILRGINVGGKRKILMADLKKMFNQMGFENVVTYIQSGNVVFNADAGIQADKLSKPLENEIEKSFNYDVPVIVRTAAEVEKVIANNPFLEMANGDIERLYVTFLSEIPSKENLEIINKIKFDQDTFEIVGRDVYGYCAGKYHKSKITNQFFEGKLKVKATSRNWKTVLKLKELSRNS